MRGARHAAVAIPRSQFDYPHDRRTPVPQPSVVGCHPQRAVDQSRSLEVAAVSDLAAVLGVNRNTVLRALRTLRDERLVEFRRGRGVTVSGTPPRGELVSRARELVRFARRQGYELDEVMRVVEQAGRG